MRVLIASWHLDHISGVETYVNSLIKNLEKEHKIEHFVQGLGPKYHKKSILPIVYPYQSVKFAIKLKSFKPEVVHLNPSLVWGSIIRDIIFLNIAKAQGYPVLFFIRGWRWSLYKKIEENKFLKDIFKNNLKKADKILVLSRDFKKGLVELGIDKKKIGVSTIMVESEKYEPQKKTFGKPYKILFCARMVEGKGSFELLEAVPLVLENYPKTDFVFMGDGPCLENLKNKVQDMNIQDNVLFTGYKSGKEKIEWYKKSHVFVLPSYTEGFPNVFLEAMAAGLPVIATPVGALRNVLKDDINGYLLESVPPEPDEIAEKIIGMLDNPNKMKEISERNLKEAKEKYDVGVLREEILDIYRNLLR